MLSSLVRSFRSTYLNHATDLCCTIALFTSTVFYVAFICGIVSMYYFYAPRPSCSLNIFFITCTVILLIVMMAMSLHSKFCKDEVKAEDAIRYNYGFFHIIFSLGAMYFAMLFISWNLENSASANQMEHGCWVDKHLGENHRRVVCSQHLHLEVDCPSCEATT